MEQKVENVDIIWVDDECMSIKCPNCKEDLTISIYADSPTRCACGHKYYFHQICPVYEVIDDTPKN